MGDHALEQPSPAVAVVIPAWNLDTELRECVGSVLAQVPRPRIVIVDNASDEPLPDFHSAEVIRLSSRVSVGAARNAGLCAIAEPYVMFMEGDDLLLPGALGHLLARLEGDPEGVAAAASWTVWNPQSNRCAAARWPFRYCYSMSRAQPLFRTWNCVRNMFPTVGPVLIRTDAARAAGGFYDSNSGEDWAFGAALCFQGRVRMDTDVYGIYRVNPHRVTLSDIKGNRFRPAWEGRTNVRRKLRRSRVPCWVKTITPLLVPFHLVFSLQDILWSRQRV